jgi:phage I-like protein
MDLSLVKLSQLIPLADGDDAIPPTEFRLFSFGANETKKGTFIFDQASAISVLDAYKEHGADLHIDWEHQALKGGKAPAAAWFKPEMRLDGLYATDVRWTPRAKKQITQREYRYFSPAFHEDKGRITNLVNVALTNLPATRNLPALIAAKDEPQQTKEPRMLTVLKALGLSDDAKEADALSATVALNSFKREIVRLTERASDAEAIGQVAAWKQAGEQLMAMSQKVAELEAGRRQDEVRGLVEEACKAGKIAPSMKSWALDLGKNADGLVALKSFIAAAPALVQAGEVKAPPTGQQIVALSAEAKLIAKTFGLKNDEFAAHIAKLENAEAEEA